MEEFRISRSRILHSHGVAEYMYRNAESYDLVPEDMYVLGLLHDIGYIEGKANHESFGALLMQRLGYDDYLHILFHGTPPSDYLSNNKVDKLPSKLKLLIEADLKVNMQGEDVGFDGRLEEIKAEYGLNSRTYRVCRSIVDWFQNNHTVCEDEYEC